MTIMVSTRQPLKLETIIDSNLVKCYFHFMDDQILFDQVLVDNPMQPYVKVWRVNGRTYFGKIYRHNPGVGFEMRKVRDGEFVWDWVYKVKPRRKGPCELVPLHEVADPECFDEQLALPL